jgi:hypothetical protein
MQNRGENSKNTQLARETRQSNERKEEEKCPRYKSDLTYTSEMLTNATSLGFTQRMEELVDVIQTKKQATWDGRLQSKIFPIIETKKRKKERKKLNN